MTALSLSGAAIYSLRIGRERSLALSLSRSFAGMWRGMSRWRWLSVTLIAIAFLLLPLLAMQAT